MNNKKYVFVLIIILLSSLTLVAQKTKFAPIPGYKKTEIAAARLEKNVPALMKEADIPGLSVALIRNGKLVWNHGFGVKNSQTKEPVTGDTVFEAASLSKPVFAYAVLKLVDSGRLDLDAPLNKYLPGNYEVAADEARINQITARRVLTHTTGFPNWRSPRNSKTLPIFFTPGERFSYSGEGFVYLSKVVEQITKMKFEDYVNEAVLKPLGMTGSSYVWADRYKTLKAFNHDLIGNPTGQGENAQPNAAGSLLTTTADYAKFVIAILNGTDLKRETRAQMLAPQIRVGESCLICTNGAPEKLSTEIGWGLGVGLQTTDEGKSFWHWGDNGNNKSFFVAFEKQKDGVIVMTNSANGLSIVEEILADGLGGKYPALGWLKPEKYNSPARVLFKSLLGDDAEKALADYRQKRGQNSAIRLNEKQINTIGYKLLRVGKTDEAIIVFRLNTEDFPDSANVWDSLAEAYMFKGDKNLALENYKKSLALNPNNKSVAEKIKQLEQ